MMLSGDLKHRVPTKKSVLRELPCEITNIMPEAIGFVDYLKVMGTKRQHPDSPEGPVIQSLSSNTRVNENLVYVRRKHDRDATVKITESKGHQERIQESKSSPHKITTPVVISTNQISVEPTLSHNFGKPDISLPVPETNIVRESEDFVVDTMDLLGMDTHHLSSQYGKERFDQLAEKVNDWKYGDYTRNLHNLSAEDLSRHAYEVEKRALLLMVKERREMSRTVKLLKFMEENVNIKAPSFHP